MVGHLPSSSSSKEAPRLLIAMALLLGARAAATTSHSMWWWGLNEGRFLPPALVWTAWILCALAVIPRLARPMVQGFDALGDVLTGPRFLPRFLWAALGGALVWFCPDRVHHAGDFLLREGAARSGALPATFFPQEFPLDVTLHHTIPHALMQSRMDVQVYERILGAGEAAGLAWIAAALARLAAGGRRRRRDVGCLLRWLPDPVHGVRQGIPGAGALGRRGRTLVAASHPEYNR
jgi:hypothetical protein